MPDTHVTVIGNVVDDPDLRFTPNGVPVANFRLASTPSTYDKVAEEWKDGETLWLGCTVWRQAAENVAASLRKGVRVVVAGRLRARSYEDREGVTRTAMELEVEEVGPSLRFASAEVRKNARPEDVAAHLEPRLSAAG